MSEVSPRPTLAIVGPTAAGKERLGVQVAERLSLPILVCDSVKVYRGLNIGSAKPSAEARAKVEHRLIDLVDPDQPFSAGDYARAALAALEQGPAMFVGGTGFYLRAVGWSVSGHQAEDEDPVDDPRRVAFDALWNGREAEAPGAAHRALAAVDPETAAAIHPRNVFRTLRALWLCERHGEPVSVVRRRDPPRARIPLMLVVLDPGAADLEGAVARRLDRMLAAGWLDEVEKLVAAGYDARHKAMRSLGYRQLLDVVQGRSALSEAREAIQIATRQYARRQRLYFRSQLPAEPIVRIDHPDQFPWREVEKFLARGQS